MRLGVIADVHANLPALQAVLREVAREQCDQVVCLGDLVGYNAHPRQVIAHVRATGAVVVAGNHDRDVTRDKSLSGSSKPAIAVQQWTRQVLRPEELEFIASLPGHHIEPKQYIAAHGCFLNTEFYYGYVTSTMLSTNLEAIAKNNQWPHLALCGHTHVPMCGWMHSNGTVQEHNLRVPLEWPADAAAVLINPGAVGQPRDGDPRAAWALIDTAARTVEGRRVAYDIEATIAAIAAAGLPPELGERLREGR